MVSNLAAPQKIRPSGTGFREGQARRRELAAMAAEDPRTLEIQRQRWEHARMDLEDEGERRYLESLLE